MVKIAFLFPGQGAQIVGMGKDFAQNFSLAKEVFQEADEVLQRSLSEIIFNGPQEELVKTKNCQTAIFVTSIAILRVIQNQFSNLIPHTCSGLSLGEYTALTASKKLTFEKCLPIVEARGLYMSEACDSYPGKMAAILGLSADQVETMVKEMHLPNDLWVANFNCPGQVIVSGTNKGIEKITLEAKEYGAKRVIPLQVHGAFHSGLMQSAQTRLAKLIENLPLLDSSIHVVMNVPGGYVENNDLMRQYLIEQVTHPVRWEQGINAMEEQGVTHYVEIGPGKTLTGMNKRIGVLGKSVNVAKVEDLDVLSEAFSKLSLKEK